LFPRTAIQPILSTIFKKNVNEFLFEKGHPFLKKLIYYSKQLNLVTVSNFYLLENEKKYDASPVINSDGAVLGFSKMVHIVQIPQFYEQDYYHPSDTGFKVYDTSAGKIGVVICYDRHFPESIRTCVLKGAQIIVIPTAIVQGEPLEKFDWELRISAMQNNVFIAICNRVGVEGEMVFCGGSMVVNPDGDIIKKAGEKEQVLLSDVDFSLIEKSRKIRPYLKLRRPQIYL